MVARAEVRIQHSGEADVTFLYELSDLKGRQRGHSAGC